MTKKHILAAAAWLLTTIATGQTLNISTGSVTYQFPSSKTGDMTYSDGGKKLTVLGKTFAMSDITSMTVDNSSVTDNEVSIVYNGTEAKVSVAGNVAQWVTPTVSGAHVTIAQTNTADVDGDEITYRLSGTSSDGELALEGSYKCTVALSGVTLANPTGAAINISNKKRIQISATEGTTNSISDGSGGSQKGAIYSKGQIQLQGKGLLAVVGNTKHAIKSGDYVSVKNLTLQVTAAVGDGISCNKYFLMKSGTVTISGVGDDGIQCDLEDDSDATGETTDHEDENSGNVYIEDGTLTVSITAAAAKGVKAAGDMKIGHGTINVTTTGNGAYDSDEQDAKGCAGLKADGNMTVSGGTLTLKSTGSGGKCIKVDGLLTVSGGTIDATTTGAKYTYSSNMTASPKAIKAGTATATGTTNSTANPRGGFGGGGFGGGGFGGGGFGGDQTNYTYSGGIVITGGTVNAKSANHEAIEAKSTISISGGYVYAESNDDAINAASDITISGGYVMGNSSGNDGMDSNGNFYIKGGNVFAIATTQPEVGIDANTEGGKQLYITGGNIVAIGGLENGSSISGVSRSSANYSKGSWYTLYSGSTAAFTFKVPSNSRMGNSMVICAPSSPTVKSASQSGATFWSGYGCSDN